MNEEIERWESEGGAVIRPTADAIWDERQELRGPVVNGEQFSYGYTEEAARYEQSTRHPELEIARPLSAVELTILDRLAEEFFAGLAEFDSEPVWAGREIA